MCVDRLPAGRFVLTPTADSTEELKFTKGSKITFKGTVTELKIEKQKSLVTRYRTFKESVSVVPEKSKYMKTPEYNRRDRTFRKPLTGKTNVRKQVKVRLWKYDVKMGVTRARTSVCQ